jgi:2-polyprenyl-3-methyl-5-hydroxy-6-metoxy-1,4-benzoquinol methylase
MMSRALTMPQPNAVAAGYERGRAACPLCNHGGVRPVRPLPRGYELFACPGCGAGFCIPFAGPAAEFYEQASDLGSSGRHSGPTDWYRDHPSRRSPLFQPGRQGRLLDVGCGNGAFAAFAAAAGYEVTGLDIDSTSIAIAHARGLARAEFHRAALEEYAEARTAAEFDVVTMFEVFEHLERPAETLGQIRRLLRPGGLFVGSLPNTERFLMWRLHMDYEMPPYHLTYWTVKSWTGYLQDRHQFEILRCEPTIYYGYASDVLMYKHRLPRLARSVVGRLLRPLEVALEARRQRGASFYFEVRCR